MILLIAVLAGALLGFIRAKVNHSAYQSVKINHIWAGIAGLCAAILHVFSPFHEKFNTFSMGSHPVDPFTGIVADLYLGQSKNSRGSVNGCGLAAQFSGDRTERRHDAAYSGKRATFAAQGEHDHFNPGRKGCRHKRYPLGKGRKRSLWFLGDIFLFPEWLRYPLAFSPGDVLLSAGVFWLFWELGSSKEHSKVVTS